MNTIEQAREVAERLRGLMGAWPLPQEAADIMDILIAELAALKSQEPACWIDTHPLGGTGIFGWAEYPVGTNFYLAAGAQEQKTFPLYPPQQFIEYVAANYSGEVVFSDPEWHAKRLWNSAMLAAAKEQP